MNKRNATAGFSLLELVVVITMIGALTAISVPRISDAMVKQSVRGARQAVAAQLAQARGAASHRGCQSVLHFRPSLATTWVTSCGVNGAVQDTVGGMKRLGDAYGVTISATVDSLVYQPTGVTGAGAWTTITFAKGGVADTLQVTPLGRAAL